MDTNTNQKLTRAQNLRAMQTLVITMGGVKGYREWLAAMPEGTSLTPGGGVDQAALMVVAESDDAYNAAMMAFKAVMTPVLAAM